ncbi:MAG: MATE family efflux transporter [Clostridium sp.]|nr:MATE family efflux transporter [Clostridium sp.]
MNSTNRIAVNSMALYINMIVTMIVSLISTRFILDALGSTEYGIYALIANIVSMFSFLNVAMSAASQRYLSYAIGANEEQQVKNIFYSSLFIHLCIAAILIISLSICGLLFIGHLLDIPANSVDKARIVLFCMIAGVFFTVTAVPYEATMNAHEDIFIIAGINIMEALLKLLASAYILCINHDKLIVYSVLIMLTSMFTFICKRAFSRKHYKECHYTWHKIKDYRLIKEMTGFAGWNLIGVGAAIARFQGAAILLNIFWGIAINAAYGIAQQLNGFLMFFANSTIRPLRPQIIKSEGAGEHNKTIRLSLSACRITFLLLALAVIPLYVNMPFVLNIWLKSIPKGTLFFCRGFLLITLIVQLTIGLQIALESVGKIRLQHVIIGTMHLLALPAAYIFFRAGFPPYCIMWCIIAEELINILLRIIIARKDASIPAKMFLRKTIIPCSLAFAIVFIATHYLSLTLSIPITRLFVTTAFVLIALPFLAYFGCLTPWEKEKLHALWRSVRSRKL